MQTDRLAQLLLRAHPRRAAKPRRGGVSGEIHVTGDPLCDTWSSWRARVQPAGRRLPARHRAPQLQHRRPQRLQAVLACLARSPLAGAAAPTPAHPRAHRLGGACRRRPDQADRAGLLHAHARARARRPRDRHRLRRRPARGLPVGRALPHPARGDRVGGHRRAAAGTRSWVWTPTPSTQAVARPAPAARPPIFGDGHAAQRIAAIVMDFIGRQTTQTRPTRRRGTASPPARAQPAGLPCFF